MKSRSIALYLLILLYVAVSSASPPPDWTDENGNIHLHTMAEFGDERIALMQLCVGADPNHKNNVGQTPLHVAVTCKTWHIAKLLIEHGAHINEQDGANCKPIDYAVLANCQLKPPLSNTVSGDPIFTLYMCLTKLNTHLKLGYPVPKDIKKMLCRYAITNAISDNQLE